MNTVSVNPFKFTGIVIFAHLCAILCTGKKQQAEGNSNILTHTVADEPY